MQHSAVGDMADLEATVDYCHQCHAGNATGSVHLSVCVLSITYERYRVTIDAHLLQVHG